MTDSPDPLFRGITDRLLNQAADPDCHDLDCTYHGRINRELQRRKENQA